MFPNSAVFRRRGGSSSARIGVGGGDAGAVSSAGGFASVSLDVMGVRGEELWRGGEGGELGEGGREVLPDGLVASFASPPGGGCRLSSPSSLVWLPPAPHMDPLLTAHLNVVDYVLRKPFSDEMFRLLLEATEIDHRRVSADKRSFVGLRVAEILPCNC